MEYKRRDGIEYAEMDQEVLLYDPGNVKFCALNPTAGFVWERLATSRSFEALLSDLTGAYAVPAPESAEQDLRAILRELAEMSFVTAADATAVNAAPLDVAPADSRDYFPPRLRMMDEAEVLSEFQVTSAGISWWLM
jgi:hypothetical protein